MPLRPRLHLRSLLSSIVLLSAGASLAQESPRDPQIARFDLKAAAKAEQEGKSAAAKVVRGKSMTGVGTTEAGPWGVIEYFTTQLEVPLELLKLWEVPSLDLEWYFPGIPAPDVEKLFRSLSLPPAIEADLLAPGKWRTEGNAVIVSPSEETVENLPVAARNAIYAVLARFSENRFQFEPTLVPGGDATQWLGSAGLRPEIVALIQKMLHQRGKATVFSDKALVLRRAVSDAERLAIRKALSRTGTLIGKLQLGAEADAGKLAEYWSAGRRFKEIEPFLESMIANEGVRTIDLIHLLPASVRKLLYTFPNESHGRGGYYPDCHWTSLNFFNYEPLQRLAEPPLATAYTIDNYVEVVRADRLGDVIFLMDPAKTQAYHSCVFIAADIVYTKNGRSRLSPWVLMKLDDVKQLYAIYQDIVTVAYRLKTMK